MKKIYDIIINLRNSPKINDKREILKKYKGDQDWYRFLKYVLDEVNYIYGKKKLPIIADCQEIIHIDSEHNEMLVMYNILDNMKNGDLKGKEADEAIQDFLVGKEDYWIDLFGLVLKRDLKAKTGISLVNKEYDRLVPLMPYQRCESESYLEKRITFPCIVQTKADALFTNMEVMNNGEDILPTTRYGRDFPMNEFFESFKIFKTGNVNIVIHGEMIVKDDNGNLLPREESNGLVNSYVLQTETTKAILKKYEQVKTEKAKKKVQEKLVLKQEEWIRTEKNLVYKVWDVMPQEDWLNLRCNTNYIHRWKSVQSLVNQYNTIVNHQDNCSLELIDSKIVNNMDELMEFYRDQLVKGEEGAVAKNLDIHWEHDINRGGVIKLKEFPECDLVIIGHEPGDEGTQFVEGISGYICESSCGSLRTKVSGLKYHEKGFERVDSDDSSKGYKLIDGFNPDDNIGKIMACKFNEIMYSKKEGDTHSLFSAHALEIREPHDKNEADDFQKIESQKKRKTK